jgi:outer membrane protein assembly factor BamA
VLVLRPLPLLLILLFGAMPQQASLPLGEVQVAGTKRFTTAEVTKVSGLATGQSFTAADFEAAAKRMAATGLFKRVAYRYAAANGRWVVTFEIEDFDWNVPVIFDNFIWFSDEELTKAVREGVPSFAGTAPATPQVTELLTGTLQRLLKSKAIPGRVDFLPEADLGRTLKGYLFRVVDPAPPVCTWTFTGATGISAAELEAEMTAAGKEYSRTFVTRASKGTLTTLYRRLGYWRATVSEPAVSVSKSAACDGVSVAMTLNEGVKYLWAGAEWTGVAALTAKDLDRALAMKIGEPAGLRAIEDGLRRITSAYGVVGHIMQRATFSERLDDTTRQATFTINVVEGPQFRMGAVEFSGVSDADAAVLAQRWRLKPGEIFDASYPQKFVSEEINPRMPRGSKPPVAQTRADTVGRTVSVRFVFAR